MQRSMPWVPLARAMVVIVAIGFAVMPALAHHQQTEDLLGDNPTYSSFNLELRPYLTMPAGSANIISMTTRLGDNGLYVTTQEGKVHLVTPNGSGAGTRSTWFDIATTGVSLFGNSGQAGLQSIAFHPEFDQEGMPGHGKFYATLLRSHSAGANFLGNSSSGAGSPDGVLAEWTYNHANGTFSGFRELFRVNMPVNDHPIKQARFNPYAVPGDEDYGLLYLTHGDSNPQHSPDDHPQLLSNALGKMIRVNPLDPDGAGTARYSIPATNPFAASSDPAVLKEVYAYGFRNPHNFSFNKDDNGDVHILVGNIGRANVEEVELALPGHNYGWPNREGTFVEKQLANSVADAGYISGVDDLPANEANVVDAYGNRNTYPVAQFDHNAQVSQVSSDSSIASGFVIRNGSDPNLHNQLLFNNFPEHDSFMYRADFDDILSAVTTLDPNDPTRDTPDELTQAPLSLLRLALDHDNNPATPAQVFDDVNTMLADTRNDTRYGEGVFGEMYISTKRKGGVIYLVTNSMPLLGDFNKDRVVDAADYTVWRDSLNATGYHLAADGNGDAKVDAADYDVWRSNFGKVWGAAGAGALSVPEPASAALFASAGLFLSASRFRRKFTH
jgi:glucose/arabinose dehydrogenase